jgi:hypothetical protein
MVAWSAVVGALSTAYSIYEAHENEQKDAEARKQLFWDIVQAVHRMQDQVVSEILEELRRLDLVDLQGRMNGVTTRFSDYDIYDPETQQELWSAEHLKLAAIVADAADLLGHLDAELDSLDLTLRPDVRHAVRVLSLYATLVPFRATAMLEEHYTYGAATLEDIEGMLKMAWNRANELLPKLRSAADARFSGVTFEPVGGQTTEPYSGKVGYKFDSKFVSVVPSVKFDGPGLEQAIQKAEERLVQHRHSVFMETGGSVVKEILEHTC